MDTCDTCKNGACSQYTGLCLDGCIDGWYGDKCELRCDTCIRCLQNSGLCRECPAEKYGSLCQHNCSNQCMPTEDGYKSCDINTAACASLACVQGYYGPDCETRCHSNCQPGPDGKVLCDFTSGRCSFDCKNLFFGDKCERACDSYCHDKTCDRNTGRCADCFINPRPPNCPDAGIYSNRHIVI